MGTRRNKVYPEHQRTRHTGEFRLQAVRLLRRGQRPATRLVLELGIARNRLCTWQGQHKAVGAQGNLAGSRRWPKALARLSPSDQQARPPERRP